MIVGQFAFVDCRMRFIADRKDLRRQVRENDTSDGSEPIWNETQMPEA